MKHPWNLARPKNIVQTSKENTKPIYIICIKNMEYLSPHAFVYKIMCRKNKQHLAIICAVTFVHICCLPFGTTSTEIHTAWRRTTKYNRIKKETKQNYKNQNEKILRWPHYEVIGNKHHDSWEQVFLILSPRDNWVGNPLHLVFPGAGNYTLGVTRYIWRRKKNHKT